ncbi:isoprenylcysteine carboxylmethyltransferase family protein [Psychrobacter sp. CAL346-MNA-CIBAN-0220]|uniref:methyltransferase family protein n=1 Tax=Psychrobacter sp. CAL346-MNA-CIBAN-0220 TaxID=3140457 RepID=UPI003333D2E2
MKFLELKVPPVLQVLTVGAAMYGVSKTLPSLQFSLTGSGWLASALAVTGLGVGVMGVTEFKKAQTTVNPHTPEKATDLVTSGIYQYSRNPMYLGLVLILLGWALYLSHVLAFVLLPVFIIYMSRFQIQAEEKIMMQKFGDKYQAYLTKVRRWL